MSVKPTSADKTLKQYCHCIAGLLAPKFNEYLVEQYTLLAKQSRDPARKLSQLLVQAKTIDDSYFVAVIDRTDESIPALRTLVKQMLNLQISLLCSVRGTEMATSINCDYNLPETKDLLMMWVRDVLFFMASYCDLLRSPTTYCKATDLIHKRLRTQTLLNTLDVQQVLVPHLQQSNVVAAKSEEGNTVQQTALLLESERPADPTALPPEMPDVVVNVQKYKLDEDLFDD